MLTLDTVVPNASNRQLKVLIDYGCEASALFHPRIFANVDEDTYPAKVRKSFVPATNVTPLVGGERQADVRLRFVGRTDEASKFPKNVDIPVTGYIVPHLGWDVIVGHPWGWDHCVAHFACFNGLYLHHPWHAHVWLDGSSKNLSTGCPIVLKPVKDEVRRQGLTQVQGIVEKGIGADSDCVLARE